MRQLTRRQFLKTAAATGTGVWSAAARFRPLAAAPAAGPFSFGLVTDVHHADAPAKGTRHYRDSLAKLRKAIDEFNRRGVAFVVELGDLIDAGPTKADELAYLGAVNEVYKKFDGPRHYVLGNHCLAALTKQEFLDHVGAAEKRSYYAFDAGPCHFVVLDADFLGDGSPYAAGNYVWTDTWIPTAERQWLAEDLRQARGKSTFVFIHQNLHDETNPHGVKNAPEVRKILESADGVRAVFQGHMHTGGHAGLGGIDYFTLRAMVEGPGLENNAYAVVTLEPSGRIVIEGFAKQPGKTL